MRRLMAFLALALAFAVPSRAAEPVDVALVLAVDASSSVSREEFGLQMDGIAAAFRDPAVLRAIRGGPSGAIAVTLVEWSSPNQLWRAFPWTLVNGPESAEAIAVEIENTPRRFAAGGTAIGAALDFSLAQFEELPFPTGRRVIDVSGDGRNTHMPHVEDARDRAMALGVTVNGLPILSQEADIDRYFENYVIGGNGAFIEVATDYGAFAQAMARKLLREIRSDPLISRAERRSPDG